MKTIEVVILTKENLSDLNKANQPFDIIGHIDIKLENGKWSHSEVINGHTEVKLYPNYNGACAEDYASSHERAAYLAYDNGICVGQILLAKSWNGYAHVEDLSVAKKWRRQGIGTALLNKAILWAKENKLHSLSLECQSNNVTASRFYIKHGFEIGGVNTKLYSMLGAPYETETAVFWYKGIDDKH